MVVQTKVAVVGSGIIGMTTALCLSRADYEPIMISKDDVLATTSAAAAAFWYPYHAQPIDRVSRWAKHTLSVFRQENCVAESGVNWTRFVEYFCSGSAAPWWSGLVDNFRDEGSVELSTGQKRAFSFDIPVVDTSLYLNHLRRSLQSRGIRFISAELKDLNEAFECAPTVINCSGIGAIKLAKDSDLHAARGQIVRIRRRAEHTGAIDLTEEPRLAHVTPRVNDTVLGGTYEENNFSLEPDTDEMQRIIRRCQAIAPELKDLSDSDVLGISCGLRPVRSIVRVEHDANMSSNLFHNYGHGGAGFTLSWGCAEEICSLLRQSSF